MTVTTILEPKTTMSTIKVINTQLDSIAVNENKYENSKDKLKDYLETDYISLKKPVGKTHISNSKSMGLKKKDKKSKKKTKKIKPKKKREIKKIKDKKNTQKIKKDKKILKRSKTKKKQKRQNKKKSHKIKK